MNDTTEEQQEQQDFPGKRLAEAREAAGLSRSEVASQLRLNVRMIVALEEDNYDIFPSATFVSGYLRSYARILGLPEEEYVRPVTENIKPPSLVSTIGSKEQVNSSDLPVRLVTYLLVIAVIGSVAMWWLAQRDNGNSEQANVPEEVVDADGNLSLNLPDDVADVADVADGTNGTNGTNGTDGTDGTDGAEPAVAEDVVTDEVGGDAQEPVAEATVAEEPQPAEAVADDQPLPDDNEVADVPVNIAAVEKDEVPPPLTAETPKSKLEIRYQADSWTEVNDSAGRSLVYGLIKAGQVLELKGEAPFRVFLGYAPGVTVYYNGDLFDHSPFQRRDVARFRIGRAEHNLPGPR